MSRRFVVALMAGVLAAGLLARERKVVLTVEGGDPASEEVAFLKMMPSN